jgi:hypothetical protein
MVRDPEKLTRDHYERFIKASAISKKIAEARKYRSISRSSQAEKLVEQFGFYEAQVRLPSLLIPIWGASGGIVAYQLRPSKPRTDRQSGKLRKYENQPNVGGHLDIHPSSLSALRKIGKPLWITEGIRKADALTSAGALTLAIYGVWNWRGTDEGGAICRLPDWEEIPTNRDIYIAFDSDVMRKLAVQKSLERIGRWLETKGANVRYVYLPDAEDGERQGVDDFLAADNTLDDLVALAEDGLRGLPEVHVGGHQLRDTSRDVLETLVQANDPPQVFCWGPSLARIRWDEGVGPSIEPLDKEKLRSHMALVADYVRYTKAGRSNVWPPKELASEVLAHPEWPGLPRLNSLAESPTVRPDGSILDTPGFDEPTGLVYIPSPDLDLYKYPDKPSPDQLKKAMRLLWEMVRDFPFDTDADFANYLAFLLTPILLPAIEGSIPLALSDAPQQGNGKTLLVRCAGIIAMGREPELRAIPKDEEEWRKSLPAVLRTSPVMVIYDNLNWLLKSSALARVLTAGGAQVSDRLLGSSEDIIVSARTTWAITGTNIQVAKDLVRRVYRIRLDAGLSAEDIQQRAQNPTSFRHPDLIGWTREMRSQLLAALLVLARAWWVAGRPEGQHPILLGYEPWSKTVGGVLANAGVPDFLGNVEEVRSELDTETEEWAPWFAEWYEKLGERGYRTGTLYERLAEHPKLLSGLPIELSDALEKGKSSFVRIAGWKLKDRLDHVYRWNGANYALRSERNKKQKQVWRVARERVR